jgi:hypothetical protein
MIINFIFKFGGRQMITLESYPEYDQMVYVIDGANICSVELNHRKQPMIQNLILVIDNLTSLGTSMKSIVVICDASLRYKIDNQSKYSKLKNQRIILESPAGIKADKFILNYCLKHPNCLIVSNDLFREYYRQLPDSQWIKRHRIGFLKIKSEASLVPMQD